MYGSWKIDANLFVLFLSDFNLINPGYTRIYHAQRQWEIGGEREWRRQATMVRERRVRVEEADNNDERMTDNDNEREG